MCRYSDTMLSESGLRFFHSASAALSRIACRLQPVHQRVLVWTRRADFQDADPHRCWSHQGVPVCAYRDLVRLLPGAGEKVVAQHCPDWNQAHVPAITRSCGVCCSPLPHPGQAAPDSSRGPRHHSPKYARPQGRVLSTGRVRSSGRARLGQSPVLHQHVVHGLAQ